MAVENSEICRFLDKLLVIFRGMKQNDVREIFGYFLKNKKLRMYGYGWKRVVIRCSNPKCYWRGKRKWGTHMFDKPCPKCKSTGVWAGGPVRNKKEKGAIL